MKKLLYLLLTLLIIHPALAQNNTLQSSPRDDLRQRSYQQRLDVVKMQDALLHALLQIPFEKRVYVYPALFESRNISKKIVTHPQIIIWKGKKPTRIAPQMQEFAKEHLENMSAKFYPLLDPDGWPTQTKEGDWHNIGTMLQGVLVTPNNPSNNEAPTQTN